MSGRFTHLRTPVYEINNPGNIVISVPQYSFFFRPFVPFIDS